MDNRQLCVVWLYQEREHLPGCLSNRDVFCLLQHPTSCTQFCTAENEEAFPVKCKWLQNMPFSCSVTKFLSVNFGPSTPPHSCVSLILQLSMSPQIIYESEYCPTSTFPLSKTYLVIVTATPVVAKWCLWKLFIPLRFLECGKNNIPDSRNRWNWHFQ